MEVRTGATGLLLRTPRVPTPVACTSIRRASAPRAATLGVTGLACAACSASRYGSPSKGFPVPVPRGGVWSAGSGVPGSGVSPMPM